MTHRILLADDDQILLEVAGEYLRAAGFTVVAVEDGEQALRAVEAAAFDLIVTDMVMPNLDGIELIQALKRTSPRTPVIAISSGIAGMNAEVMLRAATAVGAVSVLVKPLDRQAFIAAVRAALA